MKKPTKHAEKQLTNFFYTIKFKQKKKETFF